jgi:primosomal protein N''
MYRTKLGRGMKKTMNRLMFSCKKATELIEKRLETKL